MGAALLDLLAPPVLRSVPDATAVANLAGQVSTVWQRHWGTTRPTAAVRRAGWSVERQVLDQGSEAIRSLLIPMFNGSFSVLLNRRRRPTAHECDWLVAHEYGHSMYFLAGAPPRRAVKPLPGEEDFCDAFADAMVGRQHRPVLLTDLT